jgi:hypothetical protein
MSEEIAVQDPQPEVVAEAVPEVVAEVPVVPVVEVAPVVPVTPPVPVQKRYEYQPVDEHNRSLGGKQVILYTTQDELVEKLQTQNVELIRKLRSVSRDARLGRSKDDIAPEVERIEPLVNFSEKPLSAEDRFTISQQLNDPEKFESARDKLFESAVGVTPDVLRKTLNETQIQTQQLVARQNAQEWLYQHPEFYQCQENIDTVVDYMVKNGLKPVVKNFEFAQSEMEKAGLLLSSPIVREAPVPAPVIPAPVAPVVEAPKLQEPAPESVRINEIPVSQGGTPPAVIPTVEKRQSHAPSSLNNRISSSTGNNASAASEIEKLTYADIERMPSDEYKRNLTNPAFAKHVNELEAKRPARPHPQR